MRPTVIRDDAPVGLATLLDSVSPSHLEIMGKFFFCHRLDAECVAQ